MLPISQPTGLTTRASYLGVVTQRSPHLPKLSHTDMSRSLALVYLSVLFLQTHLSIAVEATVSSVTKEVDAMLDRNGVIGEEGEEMMPSEISRRVMMMRKQYISYGTLKRDMVPCQKPGASYYACRSGQANSYSRGCNVITRCARDTSDIKT